MPVTVSSDLSVTLSADHNVEKLTDQQEALKEGLKKGESKAVGISQVMLGFLIISYSVPLMSAEFTKVLMFGVPWWSGISFIIAGAVTLVMEKRSSIQMIFMCLVISMLAVFISVIALIIYFIDMHDHPEIECHQDSEEMCAILDHVMMFGFGIKSIHICLHVVYISVSTASSFILYKERKRLNNYSLVN